MPEPDDRIPRYLGALSRRERLLMGARAFVRGASALFLGWAGLTLLVNASFFDGGMARGQLLNGALPLVVWALFTAAVLLFSLRGWRRAAEQRRQALAVESLSPELRGALLTVVDRESRPMGSPAILARLARRAADTLSSISPAAVWPGTPVRKSSRVAALSLLLLVVLGVLLPVGPVAALTTLLAPPAATSAAEAPVADARRMLIGDITLRYRYPEYTRLEPLEVPNSSGDVHAPPGTIVDITARSAIPVTTAAVQLAPDGAPAEDPQPATVAEGRSLSGQIAVARSGVWRFLLDGIASGDYTVLIEPDLPPDVSAVVRGNLLSVGLDKALPIVWSARDDYGVREVVLEVKERGAAKSFSIRKPLDAAREIDGINELTPAALGLREGASVKVRVGAWDNDAVSGTKAGWSAWIDVDVAGAYGTSERQRQNREQLRDALVLVLADTLIEPAPAFVERGAAAAWGQSLDTRYEAFDVLVAEVRSSLSGSLDGDVVKKVNEPRRALRAYIQALDAGEGKLSTADAEQLVSLQDAHIVGVEQAILFLDAVLQKSAASEVADLVTRVAQESEELRADLSNLSAQAALARLDQLARLLEKLTVASEKLNGGATKEWLNARGQEIESLMKAIREDIAAGRLEEAQEKMNRLAAALQEMADGMNDLEERQKSAENKLGEAMKAMAKELESLETEQTALRQETERAREKFGPEMDEAAERWEEVARRAEALAGETRKNEESLPPTLAMFSSSLNEATANAEGLRDSTRARDLETSLERVQDLQDALRLLATRLDGSRRRMTMPEGADRAAAAANTQAKEAAAIQKLLDEMTSQANASSPQMQQALKELSQKQDTLNQRMEKASENAQELSRQLPMGAPGLESGTKEAAEQGRRAKGAMEEGEPMDAEGGQRGAEAGLQEAQDALGDAQRNMEQMQQASGRKKKDGEQQEGKEPSGGDPNGNEANNEGEDMVLPKPEAFQTPEAYRKALLEGMSGEVPEEYKALNRRYYEELVRQ